MDIPSSKSLVIVSDKKMVSDLEIECAGDKLWKLINSVIQPAIKRDLRGDPVLNRRIMDIVSDGIEAEFYGVLDSLDSKEKMKHALSFIAEDRTNILASIVRAQDYINQGVFHRLLDKVLSFHAPLIPTPECLTALSTGGFPVITKILNLIEDPDQPFSCNGFNGNPLHENEIFFRYIVNRPRFPTGDMLVHGQYWFHQKRASDQALPIYVFWKEMLSNPKKLNILPLELLVEFNNIVTATIPYFDIVDKNGLPLWSLIERELKNNVLGDFSTGKLAALLENKRLDSQTLPVIGNSSISNRKVRL